MNNTNITCSTLNQETFYKNNNFGYFLECDEHHPCQGLGEHAHFRSFGMAFLTLFRIATGTLRGKYFYGVLDMVNPMVHGLPYYYKNN